MIKANGSIYEGWWRNDKINGCGRYLCAATGDFYIGMWKNNRKSGEGLYIFEDGMEREGIWENDMIVEGQERWPNGTYFAGHFRDGLYHGTNDKDGELFLSEQNLFYQGDFIEGKFHGLGRLSKEDEFIYEG